VPARGGDPPGTGLLLYQRAPLWLCLSERGIG